MQFIHISTGLKKLKDAILSNTNNITTLNSQTQKLDTLGNITEPIILLTSAYDNPLFIHTFGDFFVLGGNLTRRVYIYDKTDGVYLFYFNGSDMSLYSSSLGAINITALRSDVNTLQTAPSDKTDNRAIGTIYQNTIGIPIIVTVTTSYLTGTAAGYNTIQALIGTASPPATQEATQSIYDAAPATSVTVYNTISFIVPNNDYYEVTSTSVDTPTLIRWNEKEL